MPLYEYECSSCGKRFELIQKFSDPTQAPCDACGGTAERLLSAPAIQFKGSGWYVTDYGRKPAPPEKGEGKKESQPGAADKPSKSDEKKSPTPASSKDSS